jgi:hypothetical protein
MAAPETVTLTLSDGDDSEDVKVPTALVDHLTEGDESAADVVADIAMLGLAQQAHGAVHHAQGDPSEELEAAEAQTMERFEERFGQTFGEMTGHSH